MQAFSSKDDLRNWWKKLKKYPNVVGIDGDLRAKIKDGIENPDIQCIRIYVSKKIPITQFKSLSIIEHFFSFLFRKHNPLSKKDLLPSHINGIPVDVVEIGRIVAKEEIIAPRPLPPGKRSTSKRYRPLFAGISSTHYQSTACTLNCLFRDKETGKLLLSSNMHCFGRENKANVGDPILQPCYDEKTEILTREGYKGIDELGMEDEIATLNSRGELEYHKPNFIFRGQWNGPMHYYKSQTINLLVTPKHQMYVRFPFYSDNNFQLLTSDKLIGVRPDYIEFKKNCVWKGKKQDYLAINGRKFETNKWLRFFGWWITEGSTYLGVRRKKTKTGKEYLERVYRVLIKQTTPQYQKEIEESIRGIGFNYCKCKNDDYVIHSKWLSLFLRKFGKSHDKFIPKEYLELGAEHLKILFETMMKGDGNKQGHRYSTTSKRLADSFQELCLKIGYSASITKDKDRDLYRVYITRKELTPRLSIKPEIINYSGRIWDVNVPNHVINIRREGQTVWSGNSPYDGGTLSDQIGEYYKGVEIKFNDFLCPFRNFFHRFFRFFKKEVLNTVDISFATFKCDYCEVCDPIKNLCGARVYSLGTITGKREAMLNDIVVKVGRTTGKTQGKVVSTNWTGSVQYSRGTASFTDCILVEGEGFSAGGDSISGDSMMYYKENGLIKYGSIRNLTESFKRGNQIEVLAIKEKRRLSSLIWSRVVRAESHGIKPVKKVIFTNGKEIILTEDHSLFKCSNGKLFPAKIEDSNARFVTAENFERPTIDHESSEEDLEFYGYWIGDGWFEKGKIIGLATGGSNDDKEFLENYFRKKNLKVYWKLKGDGRIYSTSLVDRMTKLGFVSGSFKKRVPNWIFLLPKRKISAFIRGYLRSDGSFHSVGKDRTVIEFGSVNKDLLTDLQVLLNNFGIQSDLSSGYKNNLSRNLQYKLSIHRVQSQKKFIELIGLPKEKMKEDLLKILSSKTGSGTERCLSLRKIRNIEDCGEEEVFDLTISPSESFVANGILCHNSGSPVLSLDNEYLGALFAGSDKYTIVCKVKNIENEGNVELVIPNKIVKRKK